MIKRTDRYCLPGTSVLRNRLGITDASLLDEAMNEYASIAWVLLRQSPPERPDLRHLLDAHYVMFGRVFDWAGTYRTTDLSPVGVDRDYCPPDEVEDRLVDTFTSLGDEGFLAGLDSWDFCRTLSHYWSEVTYIHPFRDGNTRCQCLWVSELSTLAGHEIDWALVNPSHLRDARLASWNGFPENLVNYLYDRILPEGDAPVRPGFV